MVVVPRIGCTTQVGRGRRSGLRPFSHSNRHDLKNLFLKCILRGAKKKSLCLSLCLFTTLFLAVALLFRWMIHLVLILLIGFEISWRWRWTKGAEVVGEDAARLFHKLLHPPMLFDTSRLQPPVPPTQIACPFFFIKLLVFFSWGENIGILVQDVNNGHRCR